MVCVCIGVQILEMVRFYSILLHATIETLQVFKKTNENDIFLQKVILTQGVVSGKTKRMGEKQYEMK